MSTVIMPTPVSVLEPYLKPILSKRRGMALGVWGEAGIGKSYSVSSALKTLPCQHLSLHATTPLTHWANQLGKPKKLALWAEQTLLQLSKGEGLEPENIISAFGATLAGLAPFVLHLEDIHEVGDERYEFIRQLAQSVQKIKGVMLLVTSRQYVAEPFQSLRLQALSLEESRSLLEHELGSLLPPEATQWVYSKAAGNPLYTLEYLRFLTRQGNLWNDGKRWHWRKPEGASLPATVEALIELSLLKAAQDPKHETVVQAKALLPLNLSNALLAGVSDVTMPELANIQMTLARQGILHGDGFAHPLYREVTLAKLSKIKRQMLARRSLELLHDAPIEATRFLDDAALNADEALLVLERAIAEATNTNNTLMLGQLLTKKLELANTDAKAGIALEAARHLQHSDVTTATRLAELARQSSEAGSQAMLEATFLQAELLALQGHLAQAEEVWQSTKAFESQERWLAHLLQLRGAAHDYSAVLELFEAHRDFFSNAETLQHDAKTTHWLVRSLGRLGQREVAEAMIQTALQTQYSKADEALLLRASAYLAYSKPDLPMMEKLEAQIYDYAKELGNLRLMDQALFNRALALEGLGRYAERKVCLEEAMRVCQELGDVTAYMIAQRAYGSTLLEFGDYEGAETLLQGARDYLEQIGFRNYLVDCESSLSQFYLETGRSYGAVLALKHARAALECATHLGHDVAIADAHGVVARAYLENNNLSEARACLAQGWQCLRDLDLPQSKLSLRVIEVELYRVEGQHEKAVRDLQDILKEFERYGSQLEVQRLGLELDRLTHNVESARARMKWFEERELLNGVNIARRYFPELAEKAEVIVHFEKTATIEVLGALQINHNGKSEKLRGGKRQELLALLLEARIAGRSEVGRLELVDTLYPEDDELKAANNLKNLVTNLRDVLGDDAVITVGSGYALGSLGSDAETFLMTGDTTLWRGGYLEDLQLESQDNVRDSLYLTLFEKAKHLLTDDPKEVTRLSKLLLEYDSYNQDYLKLCLQALLDMKNHKSAKRLYLESQQTFADVGERLPVTWQDFLAA